MRSGPERLPRVVSVDSRKVDIKFVSHMSTYRRESSQLQNTDRAWTVTFAINGGMFHSDMRPVGLYIENGKSLVPLQMGDGSGNFFNKPNGIFAIKSGDPVIVPTDKWKGSADFATQSGTMLLIDGQIHPSFEIELDQSQHPQWCWDNERPLRSLRHLTYAGAAL